MDWFKQFRWCFLFLVLLCNLAIAATPIHHDLKVTLKPEQGYLEATDEITLPEAVREISFSLHAGFKLRLKSSKARVVSVNKINSFAPVKQYKIRLATKTKKLKLYYSGKIRHKKSYRSKNSRDEQMAGAGVISKQGVFLSISSFWFPVISDSTVVFTLSTSLPEGWSSISQGRLLNKNQWYQPEPQDDIYLIAGDYQLYKRHNTIAEAQVYLRQPDQALAERYLQVTEDYLQLYSRLLGPYPYKKFAMVENFWESGYGMPSFTLLGPRVLRLPFILHSSYPHEILHNWWGNGVFVDYSQGNWSEGITSYLADHMLSEQRGQGSNYRRDTLQRYADYVTDNREYSLKDFRGYHGQSSQAIGYGKAMMLMHMLRQQLGDRMFLAGLRLFYRDNLYKTASFNDIRVALERVSNKDLSTEFVQWTSRTGAPAISISGASIKEDGGDYALSFTLHQTQKDEPYKLQVPVYIQIEGEPKPIIKTITFVERETTQTVTLDKRPLTVSVDPLFDLFRKLDQSEIPSSLGQLFGALNPLIVLPSKADLQTRKSYRRLAKGWQQHNGNTTIIWDSKIKELPQDRAVWIFGKDNLLADKFINSIKNMPLSFQNLTIKIDNRELATDENSFVLTNRGSATIGWLHCHSPKAFVGLERKVPHYRKYSYLAFTGDNPDNILKGQWPLSTSNLTVKLDDTAPPMQLEEHQPLSKLSE